MVRNSPKLLTLYKLKFSTNIFSKIDLIREIFSSLNILSQISFLKEEVNSSIDFAFDFIKTSSNKFLSNLLRMPVK